MNTTDIQTTIDGSKQLQFDKKINIHNQYSNESTLMDLSLLNRSDTKRFDDVYQSKKSPFSLSRSKENEANK